MAVPSVLVLGLLGLAGLSLSASLVIVAVTPAAGATGPSESQDLRAAAHARDHDVPDFSAPEPMPVPAHGAWETLFMAHGG